MSLTISKTSEIFPVVKANAYGHGVIQIVKALCENRIYWEDNMPKIEVAIEN